jgi:hypothetical protein
MRKEKNFVLAISVFIIVLAISMPISFSFAIAQSDISQAEIKQDEKQTEQDSSKITGLASSDEEDNLTAGKRCEDKDKHVSDFVKLMDNGIIKVLEQVAAMLFAICTTVGAIDNIIHTVQNFLACCGIFLPTTRCIYINVEAYKFDIASLLPIVGQICCFVTCGWCTGVGCYEINENIIADAGRALKSISLANAGGDAGLDLGLIGGERMRIGGKRGLGDFRISPFDNIYTALACACPIAVIYNLRKLKTIYQVYDCCLQQACENGLSTKGCEDQLSEATCMFWLAAPLKTLVKALIAIVTNFLFGKEGFLTRALVSRTGGGKFLGFRAWECARALFDITRVPGEMLQMQEAWKWQSRSFKDPSCKDLGFDKLGQTIKDIHGKK